MRKKTVTKKNIITKKKKNDYKCCKMITNTFDMTIITK